MLGLRLRSVDLVACLIETQFAFNEYLYIFPFNLFAFMFQLVVEKMLAAEGVKRTDMTREEFTKKVWEWKEK